MIAKDSIKIQVILKKKEKEELEELAKKENRSLSNFVATILRRTIKHK